MTVHGVLIGLSHTARAAALRQPCGEPMAATVPRQPLAPMRRQDSRDTRPDGNAGHHLGTSHAPRCVHHTYADHGSARRS